MLDIDVVFMMESFFLLQKSAYRFYIFFKQTCNILTILSSKLCRIQVRFQRKLLYIVELCTVKWAKKINFSKLSYNCNKIVIRYSELPVIIFFSKSYLKPHLKFLLKSMLYQPLTVNIY